MSFYAHQGLYPFGQEPLGFGSNRMVLHDIVSLQVAHQHAKDSWGDVPMCIYTFTNYWDRSTYSLVLEVE